MVMKDMDLDISFLQAVEGFLFRSEAAQNIVHNNNFFVGYPYEEHVPRNQLLSSSGGFLVMA